MTSSALSEPQRYLEAQARWHPLEIAFWLATLLPFVLAPHYRVLRRQVAITAETALSLDRTLQGARMWKLLGIVEFDLWGTTAYSYSLAVLFLLFLVARRLINSPFGLALRGIRENAMRMPAIGAPSPAHIRKIYTIAAVIAGA